LFDFAREENRVFYRSPAAIDEVEVRSSVGLASFYSSECRERGRDAVMVQNDIPASVVRPGVEPVEICGKCGGPVDMSDWHLTFVESELELSGSCAEPNDTQYIAVVCRRCAPA
jgi:hypothetical protein